MGFLIKRYLFVLRFCLILDQLDLMAMKGENCTDKDVYYLL